MCMVNPSLAEAIYSLLWAGQQHAPQLTGGVLEVIYLAHERTSAGRLVYVLDCSARTCSNWELIKLVSWRC